MLTRTANSHAHWMLLAGTLATISCGVAVRDAVAGTGANAELPDIRSSIGIERRRGQFADVARRCIGGGGTSGGDNSGPGEDIDDDDLAPPDRNRGGICGWVPEDLGGGGGMTRWYGPYPWCGAEQPTPEGVETLTSGIYIADNDVTVQLPGGTYVYQRVYHSSPDLSSTGVVGENWISNASVWADEDGSTLTILGLTGFEHEMTWDAVDSRFVPDGPELEYVEASEETVGGSTYRAWKLVRPEGMHRTFYRAYAGGGGVTATPDELEGLPLRDYDEYGNEWIYSYTIYGAATANPAARLDEIECKRADGTSTARIEFTWQDDDALPNPGVLEQLSVYRPDSGGETEVQRVVYTYKETSDGLSDALGTEGDLIEVHRYIRFPNSTTDMSTWRQLVTQYRYHGGEANETTVDTDSDGYIEHGSSHQLKMVLSEEQIEFYAQEIITQVGAITDFDDAVDELLTLDDGDAWYSGAGNIAADIASRIISEYEASGDLRVAQQWILSSCGCGSGATQGEQYVYDYLSYTSGGYERGVHVSKYVDDGTGSMQLEGTYRYDLADFDPGAAERLYVKTYAYTSGSKTWAAQQEVDSLGRMTRRIAPSAITSYTAGSGTTSPSVSVSTSSGFVTAFSYNGDSPFVEEIRVANGLKASFGDYTQLTEYEWDSTRPWLATKRIRFVEEGTNITDADKMQVVEYNYGFHGSSDAIAWIEVETEAEKESENGPSGTNTYSTFKLYDTNGDMLWRRAADGLLAKYTYDAQSGMKLSMTMNSTNGPSGSWGTPSLTTSGWAGTGDELKSEVTVDLLGRVESSRRNVGTSFETESFVIREMRSNPDRPNLDYYVTVSLPPIVTGGASGKFTGPATVSWRNAGGRTLRTSEYKPVATSGGSSDEYDLVTTSNSLGTEIGRTVSDYAINGVAEKRRTWHDVSGDKYAETSYEYDEQGRIETMEDPDGTITRYTYDVLGRTVKTEVGTVASGGGANMVTISETFYDSGGAATQGVGDGRVTLSRVHVDGSTTRDTEFEYDYRGRRIKTINPSTPHVLTVYDNLDRVTRTAAVTSTSPTTIDGEAANRLSLSETFYSQRGKVYKSRTAIDPTQTGGNLDWQETHGWFDERGREIATWAGGVASKTEYDSLGRVTKVYATDRRGDAAPGSTGNYGDASGPAGDVVLQEKEYSYIDGTILVDLMITRIRTHDSMITDSGALSGLASAKKITTYTANYYDNAARQIHKVVYGTNTTGYKHGGSAPTVNQASPPARTASGLLMSSTVYDDHDGEVLETVAADSSITRTLRDDMGRTIAVIENYDDNAEDVEITGWDATNERWSVAGVGGSGKDVDRMTTFTYTDGGKLRKRIAHPTTGDVQETEYVYGPQAGTGLLKSYNMLLEVRYPDTTVSGDGDAGTDPEFTVTYKYNRLGQKTEMTDQNGTVHEYTYDPAGRLTKDEITTFGTGVDQWVDTIETSYDSAGRQEFVRSKDGSTVKNAVKFIYDERGRIEDVIQDADGDIGGGDDLTVSYAYDDEEIGSGNRSRLDTLTYPDGTAFESEYGSAGSVNDLLSRQEGIKFSGGVDIVSYEYLGTGKIASATYEAPGFILDRTIKHNGERLDGEYPGYDQFGRVVRHVWADDTIDEHATDTTVPNIPPVIELEMAYDKSNNRTRTIDARPGARRAMRDEVYDYDGLDRLIEAERGEWNGSTLTSKKGSQEWELDALGNWDTFRYDKDEDGSYVAANYEVEGRDHNEANEYTGATLEVITNPSLTIELDNEFDDSGNMEKSEAEVSGSASEQHLTFDGWNRLVEVEVGSTPQDLSRYAYNGLNWRTEAEIDTDTNGVYDQKRQMYYDASWRLLEERIDNGYNGIDVYAQQLWGHRYIDDSIFRREGTWNIGSVAWGTPTYDLTGPMFSVLARMNGKTGVLKERVRYRAYGEARHQWGHDVDGDGDADSTDSGIIAIAAGATSPSAAIGSSTYDVDADLDRDGDVDSADASSWSASGSESALSIGGISSSGSIVGWDGYIHAATPTHALARNRFNDVQAGRWLSRDPLEKIVYSTADTFAAGQIMNSFLSLLSNPLAHRDSSGLLAEEEDLITYIDYQFQGVVRGAYMDIVVQLADSGSGTCPDSIPEAEWWIAEDIALGQALDACTIQILEQTAGIDCPDGCSRGLQTRDEIVEIPCGVTEFGSHEFVWGKNNTSCTLVARAEVVDAEKYRVIEGLCVGELSR